MQSGTLLYSFDIILKCQNRSRLIQPAEFWLNFRRIESLYPSYVLRCAPNFVHIHAFDAYLYKLDYNYCLVSLISDKET